MEVSFSARVDSPKLTSQIWNHWEPQAASNSLPWRSQYVASFTSPNIWLFQLQASYPPCSQWEWIKESGRCFFLRAFLGSHVCHLPSARTQPPGHNRLQERLRIVVCPKWPCLQPKHGNFIMKGKKIENPLGAICHLSFPGSRGVIYMKVGRQGDDQKVTRMFHKSKLPRTTC